MKKILAIILFSAMAACAINPFTYFWTISLTGDTATVVKWKANNDSVLAFAGRVCDTLNHGVVRYGDFTVHNKIFAWMHLDTLYGTDTANITNLHATKIDSLSWIVVDSAHVRIIAGHKGVFDSLPFFRSDSLYIQLLRVGVVAAIDSIKGRIGKFDSISITNGIKAPTFTGNLFGNVTGSVTGSISGGTVSGSTGTFTSYVNVDSLHSTHGIHCSSFNGLVGAGTSGTVSIISNVLTVTSNVVSVETQGSVALDTISEIDGFPAGGGILIIMLANTNDKVNVITNQSSSKIMYIKNGYCPLATFGDNIILVEEPLGNSNHFYEVSRSIQ